MWEIPHRQSDWRTLLLPAPFAWRTVMSSTLFNVLFAWKCSSTHHKLALDALHQMRGVAAENWRNLCLAHIDTYLEGSKAPDNTFKDFRNHVLHVRDNYWGGAVGATRLWYGKTVEALRTKNWREAVYAAGVLSHYYTDPIQPFHTAQSEAEGIVHRAAEWSIACAYRDLTELLEASRGGWPEVTVPTGSDWLEQMVIAGADLANPHYEVCIDHYDLKQGVKHPPSGLDQEMRDCLAKLIGHAVVGYARIMERAFAEAGVVPPATSLTLPSLFAQLQIPILWVTQKLKNSKERAIVEAMHREYQATGKVLQTLPEDEATVRQAHAAEILQRPLAELDRETPRPIGTAHGTKAQPATTSHPPVLRGQELEVKSECRTDSTVHSESLPVTPPPSQPSISLPMTKATPTVPDPRGDKYYLTVNMPVEKAPSIGPKTAKLLEQHGVRTVADLLCVDPKALANAVGVRYVDALSIEAWQIQAILCCEVPQLRGHDAQFLLACHIFSRAELAAANATDLLKRVEAIIATPAGERILRGGERPDLAEVQNWIARANRPRLQKAG